MWETLENLIEKKIVLFIPMVDSHLDTKAMKSGSLVGVFFFSTAITT